MNTPQLKSYWLYLTVFITGAAVLVIEILGTRILAPFYGSTLFVWSSLITVTLAALASGYWIGGRVADRWPSPQKILYGLVAFAGLSLFFVIFAGSFVLIWSDIFGLRFGPLVATTILFFIPLFLLGGVSPVALKIKAESLLNIGGTAGTLYATATAGSLVGGLLSGFWLVATFSPHVILFSLSAVLFAVALAGVLVFTEEIIFSGARVSRKVVVMLLCLTILYSVFGIVKRSGIEFNDSDSVALAASGLPAFPTLFMSAGSLEASVIYQEPSPYGTITVFDFLGTRCFLLGGANDSCWSITGPSEYVRDIMYFLEKPDYEIKDILIIGVGGGTLLKALDGSDYVVDAVEINPKMIEIARKFFDLPEPDELAYEIFIDDGRHFLQNTDKKYDAIILDICNINSYSAHLWTKEFFELAKGHLKDPAKGIVIGSRNVVSVLGDNKIDHMVSNAVGESFSSLYYVKRTDAPGEFDISVFLASDTPIEGFSDDFPKPLLWKSDLSVESATDSRIGELVRLSTPVEEKIIEQTRENFGNEILLPI